MGSSGDRNRFGLLSDPTTPTPSKQRQRKRRREASRPSTSDQTNFLPTSDGSVKIYYRVKPPETEGFKFVPRHTPPKELLEAPEIQSLVNSLGGKAFVSPSKSACSETEVQIHVTFNDLIARMKQEIMDEVNYKINRADARLDARLDEHITESSFTLHCGKYASLRIVEDWALNRMKRVANLPTDMPHRDVVDFFLRNYETPGLRKEYLVSLRHSTVRQTAINYVHLSPDDAESADGLWKSLATMLSTEDQDKYRALIQFGRGLSSVRYVGGI